ncbi:MULTISPECIES: nucleoside recognition domain-containing protein [Brevibacillus]|uniref:nucleoside recognition domain-containing protein n=1 Tax=Brevibacillus TaxID=55080 RepID=UPI000D1031FE|nr:MULTISPECIES: nucleoside recognition domain-containing protein [Brevibacillus]MED1945883.1 nucleoside recognition domain-containing protein [Brevibacillus formosus]MED2001163.1 nucleoside recognition domain-containing protein [Brevibacillus formosus]MED2085216.1 nucleoside recognition domain-containing protein [Brevibacillus formosus]PSK11828.1 iron transporter FeoB [Brevibacillus sp. NRRL NRS-603]
MAKPFATNPPDPLDALLSVARASVEGSEIRDTIVSDIYLTSRSICKEAVTYENKQKLSSAYKLDKIVTSKIWGYPIMLAILGAVFWITIAGANVPSGMLADMFGVVEGYLTAGFQAVHAPNWLHGILVLGFFRGTSWVVSVMLPPMAIFFPVFSLLENFGYLPRVAFNMDRLFKNAGGHGKQALTMSMGFGCNAAAILSTRIIESPRERMLAILTNNFVPCNGRWPTLILLSSLFMATSATSGWQSLTTALIVMGMVIFGIAITLTVSWILSKTALRGVPTHYTLELPPYRRPQIWKTILIASKDKSWSVLKRAVIVAAPAGIITWVLGNIYVGGDSILAHMAAFFDPFAQIIGLDGYILMAFILGLPANEIVLPILLMGYMSSGAMVDVEGIDNIKDVFLQHGWTWLTALNMMLFSLLHYPCGTTLFNIYKETKSVKWTVLSALIPLAIAVGVTFLTAQVARALGWV